MNDKILSVEDIERCSAMVQGISENLNDYKHNYNEMIKVLEDEEIVKTFFASGIFGESIKIKFDKIRELLGVFSNQVSELTDATKKYLNNQRDLNNKGGF